MKQTIKKLIKQLNKDISSIDYIASKGYVEGYIRVYHKDNVIGNTLLKIAKAYKGLRFISVAYDEIDNKVYALFKYEVSK